MGKDFRRFVFDFINEFWHARDNFESWHKSQSVPVPKSGDLSDMNKWGGVMIMEIMSNIFSCVINVRCYEILYAHEKKLQLGGTLEISFSNGLFIIKTLLNIKNNHNTPTLVYIFRLSQVLWYLWPLFIDKSTGKIWSSINFFLAIHRIYQDLMVFLNIERSQNKLSKKWKLYKEI